MARLMYIEMESNLMLESCHFGISQRSVLLLCFEYSEIESGKTVYLHGAETSTGV